jgi:hypothetical protein
MAAEVVRLTTEDKPHKKDPFAVELGRRGGLKGGRARASSLSAERRSEIASRAARKRWSKTD